jgi:FkbM family methyltransferase
MLLSIKVLSRFLRLRPVTILHVGAHLAEEKSEYELNGWGDKGIIWVEAQEELANRISIREGSRDKVLNLVAFSKNDLLIDFKIASNSQSSSVLDFGTHSAVYPEIVQIGQRRLRTKRLDCALKESDKFELINLDVQGVELEVLIGLGNRVDEAKYIYTEVNKEELYNNCSLITDLDKFLCSFEFKRIVTRWVKGAGWGDALYVKNPTFLLRWGGVLISITYILKDQLYAIKSKLISLSQKNGV